MLESQWAILSEDGTSFVAFDSVIDFDIKNESKVLTSPIEKDSFAAYNKVETPLDIYVTLGFQGDMSAQAQALSTLDKYIKETTVVSLVTPTATYLNLTVESYTFKRSSESGMTLLAPEVHLLEVRTVDVQVSRTPKRGKSASKVNTGQTQTTKPKRQSTLYKVTHRS